MIGTMGKLGAVFYLFNILISVSSPSIPPIPPFRGCHLPFTPPTNKPRIHSSSGTPNNRSLKSRGNGEWWLRCRRQSDSQMRLLGEPLALRKRSDQDLSELATQLRRKPFTKMGCWC